MFRLLFFGIILTLNFNAYALMHFDLTKERVDAFDVDIWGNKYVIQNKTLYKLDNNDSILKSYTNQSYGQPVQVIADNPLNILLLYSETGRLLYLDDQLSPKRTALDLFDVSTLPMLNIAPSHENSFWFYDPLSSSLKLLDRDFKIIHQSDNLEQLITNGIDVIAMMEYHDNLYVLDRIKGIFIFDLFGNYVKKIPITSVSSFDIFEGVLWMTSGSVLISYNIQKHEMHRFKLENSTTEIHIVDKAIYYLTSHKVLKYIELNKLKTY